MKIPVTLNDSKIVLEAAPSENLMTVLRREKLFSVKCGCARGLCGNCSVLLNGKPVSSCTIPVGTIRDSRIETLEHIKNSPYYQDIITGFNQAGIHLCGFCNTGKILTAYNLLKNYNRPTTEQIYGELNNYSICCTSTENLACGIMYAIAQKHFREGEQHGSK